MRFFRKKTRTEEAAPVRAAAPEALEEDSPSQGEEQADKPKPRRRRGTRGGRGRGKKKVEGATAETEAKAEAKAEPKPRQSRQKKAKNGDEAAKPRRKRTQMVFGGLLGAGALVAVVVVLVLVVFNGDGNDEVDVPAGAAAIPAQKVSDVKEAAKLAGCTYNPKVDNEGAGHEEKEFQPSDYKQNPPTSGNHFPEWYDDGIYSPGDTPELGKLVHTLEHGRIDIQYKPGTPKTTVAQLETLYNEMDGGHHLLLFENTTGMKYAVAATAWDASLGCNTMNDKVFDAIRAFRTEHIDKGPEIVP